MTQNTEQYFHNVITGSKRGPTASALRLALGALEPFYAGITILRNALYNNAFLPTVRLARPVISIGNLTAGGTGKTPMVRWLGSQLRNAGLSAAVLSRGYKSIAGQLGDEQIMLDRLLNAPTLPPILLRANPNRVAAANGVLHDHPEIAVFLLDDGFQHRRVARDLDIVLLSAADPFGCDHVLPRGLLREPIGGLRRAGAVVITHADALAEPALAAIEQRIRRHNPAAPIYRAVHAHTGLRTAGASAAFPPDRSLGDLRGRRFLAFAGIGSPRALDRQLQAIGGKYVGSRWFADHHAYTPTDLARLYAEAAELKADLLLTTEKDWVKVSPLVGSSAAPTEIWRIDVEMQLLGEGRRELFEQAKRVIGR